MVNVLFDVSEEREKLPTLRQWLKSIGKRKIASVYPVNIVWKPSTYPNVVFETDVFRAIVYKGNPIYEKLASGLDDLCLGDAGLGISLSPARDGKFQIVSLDNERPLVESIGEFGYRFTYQ